MKNFKSFFFIRLWFFFLNFHINSHLGAFATSRILTTFCSCSTIQNSGVAIKKWNLLCLADEKYQKYEQVHLLCTFEVNCDVLCSLIYCKMWNFRSHSTSFHSRIPSSLPPLLHEYFMVKNKLEFDSTWERRTNSLDDMEWKKFFFCGQKSEIAKQKPSRENN